MVDSSRARPSTTPSSHRPQASRGSDSSLDADQLRSALDTAAARGLPRYDVLQPEYNLYDRGGFDGPLRNLCLSEEIGVITYFSLAKGFLSGKYRRTADLGQSPRGGDIADYLNPRGDRILSALDLRGLYP